jgi:hypothetical protein
VGTRSATYEVTTQELTPDLFAFDAVTGAALSASVTSQPFKISGVTGSVPVSVSEGNNALFRVGTGPDAANIVWWSEGFVDHTATGKTLVNDRWVQVRLTSSGAYETARTATLNVGSSSAGFSVTTGSEPVSITISTGTVPDAEEGLVYAGFDFKTRAGVTGGPSADPATVADLSWSVSGGVLPTGMTLSTAGVLSGTPTQIGSFAFTVRAAIGADVASASYTIIVNDPDGSFVIEGG